MNKADKMNKANNTPDAYLFGQILGTHSFLLKDGFLQPDEYSEIKEQYFLPGGETGTAATERRRKKHGLSECLYLRLL